MPLLFKSPLLQKSNKLPHFWAKSPLFEAFCCLFGKNWTHPYLKNSLIGKYSRNNIQTSHHKYYIAAKSWSCDRNTKFLLFLTLFLFLSYVVKHLKDSVVPKCTLGILYFWFYVKNGTFSPIEIANLINWINYQPII